MSLLHPDFSRDCTDFCGHRREALVGKNGTGYPPGAFGLITGLSRFLRAPTGHRPGTDRAPLGHRSGTARAPLRSSGRQWSALVDKNGTVPFGKSLTSYPASIYANLAELRRNDTLTLRRPEKVLWKSRFLILAPANIWYNAASSTGDDSQLFGGRRRFSACRPDTRDCAPTSAN
jgi:hypothetical protein